MPKAEKTQIETVATPQPPPFAALVELTPDNAREQWLLMKEELKLEEKDGWVMPPTGYERIRDLSLNGPCYCRMDSRNIRNNTMRVSGCLGVEEVDGKPWLAEYPAQTWDGHEVNYNSIGCERANRAADIADD